MFKILANLELRCAFEMRTLTVEPSFSSSTVKVRISDAYLNRIFEDFYKMRYTYIFFLRRGIQFIRQFNDDRQLIFMLSYAKVIKKFHTCYFDIIIINSAEKISLTF